MACSWTNRHPWFGLSLLTLLFAAQVSPLWYPTPDASGYLSIARSLAASRGPMNLGSRQIYLAPGYPLLISPVFLAGDRPFLLLSMLHGALAAALILGVYVWARRHLPEAALLLTAVALVNVELWSLFRRTLSETAFMALLVWEVNLLNWVVAAFSARAVLARVILAAVGMVALAMTRQAGITLAAGLGLALGLDAWRHHLSWTRALTLAGLVGVPAALAVVGLAHYDRAMAAASGAATYVDQIADPGTSVAGQVLEGLRLRVSEVGRLTIPGMFKAYGRRGAWWNVNMAVYVPLSALLLFGWVRWAARTRDVWALALPFYTGLYVVWPFDQATRFTVPMIPLLLACAWAALEFLGNSRRQVFQVLLVGHLAVALGYWLAIDRPRARDDEREWPAVCQVAAVLKDESGAVLAEKMAYDAVWMLQFALDRRVSEHPAEAPVGPEVCWIVTPDRTVRFDGFADHADAGKYRVLRREMASEINNPLSHLSLRLGQGRGLKK